MNDAWVHTGASNQGMFLTAFPNLSLMFGAWCVLAAEFEESPSTMNAARISQWRALAATFGLTPSDRARIAPNGQPAPDEFDEFLNRRYFDD